MKKKRLLCDVDGVLIKWTSNLPFFCMENGIDHRHVLEYYNQYDHADPCEMFKVSNRETAYDLIRRYNAGKYGRYLAPYSDAVEVIPRLAQHVELVIITSFGSSLDHWLNRKFNIEAFFPGCFSDIIVVDVGESKADIVRDMFADPTYDTIGMVDDQRFNLTACPDGKAFFMNREHPETDIPDMYELEKEVMRRVNSK
ncbi:hypothetical protein EniLVp02_0253 [Vibrio phage EniLVp02]